MSKADHAATAYRDDIIGGYPVPLTAAALRAAAKSKRNNSNDSSGICVENEYRQPASPSVRADAAIGPRLNIRHNQQRPGLSIRRFGRSDFERFNEEAANPAGIVYIDISFKQPPEHMLSNANVLITLSEDAPPAHGRFGRRRPIRTSLDSEHAVQVTEYFGPHAIHGPQGKSLATNERAFQPTIGAGGMVEIGGMGTRQSVTRQYIDSWTFKGTQKRAKDGIGLRCLEWELTENDTEKKPSVDMCVEIEGRLKSKAKQGNQRLLRSRSRSSDKDNVMVTRIDLSTAINDFQHKLDQLAFGLNIDMQRTNLEAIPVEMLVPTQATFKPVAWNAIPYADEAILNSLLEAPDEGTNELKEFLLQETTQPPASKISQPVYSGNSSSGDGTLVNYSGRTISGGSTAPKHIAWRVPEVMILALVRWLMLTLKAVGAEDVYLAGILVSTDDGVKTTADRDITIDRVESEIRSRSGSRMESVPNGRLLDAAATQSVSAGLLVPEPYGSRFQSRQRRLGHGRVSGQNGASMEL
ncbi:uncharacterized protein GLRG_06418 [Colletotrichum graminicola M1.001]|uniref:Uncharacterized protein n=1 Tax=Colletotrichum graminicola (strain M1.001 / M2 / FGSC 10212) TaxID=645133 RepID=E3QK86_COLGM|nr:uncharacterized protein GLRG_06418 [Colletotrichum graminicola M1.001]EFQ31274.1 hypothetical protein GLRG_06418 [Colletotrichum graminicola M1.001]